MFASISAKISSSSCILDCCLRLCSNNLLSILGLYFVILPGLPVVVDVEVEPVLTVVVVLDQLSNQEVLQLVPHVEAMYYGPHSSPGAPVPFTSLSFTY